MNTSYFCFTFTLGGDKKEKELEEIRSIYNN